MPRPADGFSSMLAQHVCAREYGVQHPAVLADLVVEQQPQGPMFILAFEPYGQAVTVRSRAAEQSGRVRSQRARRHVFLGGIINGSKDREEPVFGTAGGSRTPATLSPEAKTSPWANHNPGRVRNPCTKPFVFRVGSLWLFKPVSFNSGSQEPFNASAEVPHGWRQE